jgi:hypothetical protein
MSLITLKGWLFVIMITSGTTVFAQTSVDSFPENTGDIAYNAALDDSSFTLCNSKVVFQYYNTASYYKDHKRAIEHYFKSHYHPTAPTTRETGYLTIRFIINCSGKTDRFRVYELDANYQPFQFDKSISSQLLKLTKELQGWQPPVYKNIVYDSYQYITFKLVKGTIECILP